MKFIFYIFLLIIPSLAFSQVVYTTPGLPNDNQAIEVFFNAAEGDAGLKDYSGEVYAHTGVITNKSISGSDWKYVKANWEENIPSCKLSKISSNLYKLSITPDIRQFYNVPSDEIIQELAFVFRNSDGSRQGKSDSGADIFIKVSSSEFELIFTSPDKELAIVNLNEVLYFKASTSQAATITLSVNERTIFGINGTELSYPFTFKQYGSYNIVVKAEKNGITLYDSLRVFVREEAILASLPENVKDGINYWEGDSLTLVLHAPGKNHVYIIGDFNNWTPSSEYLLKKDEDKWWITLKGLKVQQEYAYQYLIDDGLLIADPYSEKVLDPWNDQYIPSSVYPDLMAYPENKTSGIVSVFEIGQTPFQWQHNNYTRPQKDNLVIYELLIRDFIETHDIKDVQQKLDYLKSLGVNAIELMPFNEFEGNSSWGYNPSFFFAPDKYYGTANDIKTFIDACHKNGMMVIMDIVLNHAYGQNPMVQMYFENGNPSEDNPWFNVTSPNTEYAWGYDFDHQSEATKYFVDRVSDYWMNTFNLDGFRFDFTKGFTNNPGPGHGYDADRIEILKRIYDTMQAQKPGSLMICEHLADNSEEKILANYGIMLWGNINHNYAETAMGWVGSSDLSWGSYKSRGWSSPNLISYMESHDEERLMYKCKTYGNSSSSYSTKTEATALQRMALSAALFFTIPGPKMIWQFGEYGYDYPIDYNGRVGEKPIVWSYLNSTNRAVLKETYSKLIKLKTQNDIFSTNDFSLDIGNKHVKTIRLNTSESHAIVFGNMDVEPQTTEIEFQTTGWWYEALTGDSLLISNTNTSITLSPGEYHVYSTHKLISTATKLVQKNLSTLKIYPNPVQKQLFISSKRTIHKIDIYDMKGRKIAENTRDNLLKAMDVSDFTPGLYILQAHTNMGLESALFNVIP